MLNEALQTIHEVQVIGPRGCCGLRRSDVCTGALPCRHQSWRHSVLHVDTSNYCLNQSGVRYYCGGTSCCRGAEAGLGR